MHNDINNLSTELATEISNLIQKYCLKIDEEKKDLAKILTELVLGALALNLVTFLNSISHDDESKFKLLEHHFLHCKNSLEILTKSIFSQGIQ